MRLLWTTDQPAPVGPSGSLAARLRQHFRRCRCPNAIIVKDDPAIVARIVRAAMSLQEMRVAAASSADAFQHFENAFRPTLHVIESQILPQISKKVRERAAQIAATLPAIPLVE
jgi:hypothetical protein